MVVQDEWGIADGYHDIEGIWHATPPATQARLRQSMGAPQPPPPMWFLPAGHAATLWGRCALRLEDGTHLDDVHSLPPDLPLGYHDLTPIDGGPATTLVVHPPACRELPQAWGVAAQIYALWSDRSWGIGDLGDLRRLSARTIAAAGRAVLVSPLHQPAPSLPQENSPYYPSSRRAWNPLLIGIDASPPPALICTPESLIDRDAVWSAKRQVLEQRFAATSELPALPRTVSVWNALCDRFGPSWREWPEGIRRYDPSALAQLLNDDRDLAARAAFHEWCQRLVSTQIDEVARTGIELIGDLAIGFAPDGADAWEFQDLLALDVRIGAPPDPFNEAGQDWGIPPFIPWRFRQVRYQPLIETIRAALRGCRGLRIDHVMGLFRQFWIPAGSPPDTGAYVRYPAEELLAIICLEAVRAGAFVVGEDLGTVEEGVRERLATHKIAGTRVVLFEDEHPRSWAPNVLATVTTHDLPTITGVWSGRAGDDEQRARLAALGKANSTEDVLTNTHGALLDSPARLRLFSLDDLCAAEVQPNQPGTIGPPNWCRRLPVSVDDIPFQTVDDLSQPNDVA